MSSPSPSPPSSSSSSQRSNGDSTASPTPIATATAVLTTKTTQSEPSSLAYLIALITLGAAFGNMFLAGKIRNVMKAEMPKARQAATGHAHSDESVRARASEWVERDFHRPHSHTHSQAHTGTGQGGQAYQEARRRTWEQVKQQYGNNGNTSSERADFAFFDPRLSHCETLGLSPALRGDERAIKGRYRELVRECHPDLVQDEREKGERQKRFQEVSAAYQALLQYIEKNKSTTS